MVVQLESGWWWVGKGVVGERDSQGSGHADCCYMGCDVACSLGRIGGKLDRIRQAVEQSENHDM